MNTQLDTFREWFRDYRDCYVVIGGTAVQLLQEMAGQAARRTKDVDLVLLLDGRSHPFYRHFWEFIRRGGYHISRKPSGEGRFYRFHRPTDAAFPQEIELFSREPEGFPVAEGSVLAPIPTDEGLSSLSAILLDADYEAFIRDGVVDVEGISILDGLHMIPLKARAWLDLSARRQAGEQVDRSDIEKHRKDIFRLASYLPAEQSIEDLPEAIAADMRAFLRAMAASPFDVSVLGIRMPFSGMMQHLSALYGLDGAC